MLGDMNNDMIFQQGLAVDLGLGKKVGTNTWYLGVLLIDDMDNPEKSRMIEMVKLRY
jgi:hypothetical protein